MATKQRPVKKYIDHSDPLNCQTHQRLGYCEWHDDAEARGARGENQWFCSFCARYRWKEHLCADGRACAVESTEPEPAT